VFSLIAFVHVHLHVHFVFYYLSVNQLIGSIVEVVRVDWKKGSRRIF